MTSGAEKDARVGEVLQDAYRLERVLGEGGMGTVYEASHLRLARRFAIKLLRREAAKHETALTRFQREAEIVSSLGHPHILEVIDFNHAEDGTPYIVMELLDGEDLGSVLKQTGRLDLDVAGLIVDQTASAVQAAHEQGIIHRDLKPENIFLCRRKGVQGLHVKVVDFGVSKMLGEAASITHQYQVVGTPQYMSPEQAQESAKVDLRTDIYSLALIAYEMLTGERPFTADSVPALMRKIVEEEPTPLRELRPEVPEPVADVIKRALHKDRERRFSSMKQLADDLRQTIHGEIFQPAAQAATIDLVLPRWQATEEAPPAGPFTSPTGPDHDPREAPTKLIRPLKEAERASTLPVEGEVVAKESGGRALSRAAVVGVVVIMIGAAALLLNRSGEPEADRPPADRTLSSGAAAKKQLAAPSSQPVARPAAADAGAAGDLQRTSASRPAAVDAAGVAARDGIAGSPKGRAARRKRGTKGSRAKQRKVGVGMMGY